MRNLVLLLAMIAGGVAGYFIGAQKGRNAVESLARLEVASERAQIEHRRTVKVLDEKVSKLSARYQKEKSEIDAAYAKQQELLEKEVSSRDRKIAGLNATIAWSRGQINAARTRLGKSMSPEQRATVQAEIARLLAENKSRQTDVAGFECAKIPVPADYLDLLAGGKS